MENVHVITQESLKADMDGATRRLAAFAGNAGFDGVLPTHRSAYAPSYPNMPCRCSAASTSFRKAF